MPGLTFIDAPKASIAVVEVPRAAKLAEETAGPAEGAADAAAPAAAAAAAPAAKSPRRQMLPRKKNRRRIIITSALNQSCPLRAGGILFSGTTIVHLAGVMFIRLTLTLIAFQCHEVF